MSDNIYIKEHNELKHVWTITISYPEKKNCLTPVILKKISNFLSDQKIRKTARVIIIRGEGEYAFSSGYDISKIQSSDVMDKAETSSVALYQSLHNIKNFPAPLISMISGFCIGAGLHLAITTDIRIASENSKIGITPTKIGLLYHPDGILDFFNLTGAANTKELFFTGKLYSALDAKQMGLINHVVPLTELERTVYSLAEQISCNAPLSVRATKYCINKYIDAGSIYPEIRNEIIQLREKIFNSQDIKEGKKAFAEKRKPVFTGK